MDRGVHRGETHLLDRISRVDPPLLLLGDEEVRAHRIVSVEARMEAGGT